ncbi:DNA polymerase III subunit beta [Erythrobacter sp. NE805]|uniref:DNA polymerase III subunit beta n=1 Tax=Erythrobacter sp. NE805 TaxID=3389875 RepID=UPI00396B01F5
MQTIIADRRAFARALDLATSVADRRSTIPICQTVNIVANGALRFEATDLDTFATVEIGYIGEPIAPFALKGPEKVGRALRQLDSDTVSLSALVDVAPGGRPDLRAPIASGQFRSSMATMPSDDFPTQAPIGHEEFAVDLGQAELALIARVIPAISTEETRYYLNGICVDRIDEWTYRFVATDGHRLMIADVPLPGAVGIIPDRTVIPRRFVNTVMRHFARTKDAVRLTYGRRLLENKPDKGLAPELGGAPLVSVAGKVGPARLALTSKLIDGTYPEYTRVIPSTFAHTIRASRSELLRAIRGLVALADGKVRALKIEAVDGGVRLSTRAIDLGDGSFVVPAEHGFKPETMIVGFNGQYLLDCLTSLRGEEVQFDLDASHEHAPAAIHDPADTAFRCVLMPMRV